MEVLAMTTDIQQDTLTIFVVNRWTSTSGKLLDLADAFSQDQLESRPIPGTRSPAEVLRHVAFWNRYVACTLRGQAADDSANELPREQFATKARILEVVDHSAKEVSMAIKDRGTSLAASTLEHVVPFIEHTSEHYGQLVAHARLLGIVPPVSRT
jgi:uncharacterized damage-inducible protein DinB